MHLFCVVVVVVIVVTAAVVGVVNDIVVVVAAAAVDDVVGGDKRGKNGPLKSGDVTWVKSIGSGRIGTGRIGVGVDWCLFLLAKMRFLIFFFFMVC